MANDMMSTLKGILGDNADEKIQSVLNGLQSSSDSNSVLDADSPSLPVSSGGSNEYLDQIKSIVNQMGSANDTRSNLLLSLKPYMRTERQRSIDNAVKILNLTKFSGLFK